MTSKRIVILDDETAFTEMVKIIRCIEAQPAR